LPSILVSTQALSFFFGQTYFPRKEGTQKKEQTPKKDSSLFKMSGFRGRGGRSWGSGVNKREIQKPERYPKPSRPFPKLKDVWRGSENPDKEMEVATCHAEYEFNRRNSFVRLVFNDTELMNQIGTSNSAESSEVPSKLIDLIIKSDSQQFPAELHSRKPHRQVSRKKKKKRKVADEVLDNLKRSGSESPFDGPQRTASVDSEANVNRESKPNQNKVTNDDDENNDSGSDEMAESDLDEFRHEVDDDDMYGDDDDDGNFEATC